MSEMSPDLMNAGNVDMLCSPRQSIMMQPSSSPQYYPTSPGSNSSPLISRSPAGSQSKGGSAIHSKPFSDGPFGAPPVQSGELQII